MKLLKSVTAYCNFSYAKIHRVAIVCGLILHILPSTVSLVFWRDMNRWTYEVLSANRFLRGRSEPPNFFVLCFLENFEEKKKWTILFFGKKIFYSNYAGINLLFRAFSRTLPCKFYIFCSISKINSIISERNQPTRLKKHKLYEKVRNIMSLAPTLSR